MGNFSQKGVKGVFGWWFKQGKCSKFDLEAMECNFISYDVTEGEYDFIVILEADSEQIIATKVVEMNSDDFDGIISIKAESVDSIRKNLKQMQSVYTPPSAIWSYSQVII